MKAFLRLCWLGLRRACASVFSLLLWSLWLVLAVVLAGQLWSLTSHQLALPGFVLSALEDRLAASGLKATFGKTLFDPSGRILVEDARLLAPSFQEPLVTARAAYNVTPETAGWHVRKLQCFCFNAETLQPHQSAEWPVIYFVDPKFVTDPEMKGYNDLTFSYTFVPDPAEAPRAAPRLRS